MAYKSEDGGLTVTGHTDKTNENSVEYYGGYSIFVSPTSKIKFLTDVKWHPDTIVIKHNGSELPLTDATYFKYGAAKGYLLSDYFKNGENILITDVGRDQFGEKYDLQVSFKDLNSNLPIGVFPELFLRKDADDSLLFNLGGSNYFKADLSFVSETTGKPTEVILNQLIGDIDGNQEISTSFGNLMVVDANNRLTSSKKGNIITFEDLNSPSLSTSPNHDIQGFNRAPEGTVMLLSKGTTFSFEFGKFYDLNGGVTQPVDHIKQFPVSIQFNLFGNADVVKVVTPALKRTQTDYHFTTTANTVQQKQKSLDYERDLENWKKHQTLNPNGVVAQDIKNILDLGSEPEANSVIEALHPYTKITTNGWIIYPNSEEGDFLRVTYTNLKNTFFYKNGQKIPIAKIIRTFRNFDYAPSDEGKGWAIEHTNGAVTTELALYVSENPIGGATYVNSNHIEVADAYIDSQGQQIDPTGGYYVISSLNSNGLSGTKIEKAKGVGVTPVTLVGSAVSAHSDGSLYSELSIDNVVVNPDGSFQTSTNESNNWDDLGKYAYFGSGLFKITSPNPVLTFYVDSPNHKNRNAFWFALQTRMPSAPLDKPTTSVNYHFTTTINPCKIALIFEKEAIYMQKISSDSKFVDYYRYWIELYKVGSVRQVTLDGYWLVLQHLQQLIPNLQLKDLNHRTYQALINDFAQTHERKTVKGFHTHLKAALVDGLDEGIIAHDPTRHLVLKGKDPKPKKIKYLSMLELKLLIHEFDLNEQQINFDWLLFLISKTGLRIAEAIGLTRQDFDFANGTLSINKTWNYRSPQGGFQPTKNKSSNRVIAIDPILTKQFEHLTKHMENTRPIFVPAGKRFYVSSINNRLQRHCKNAGVPVISVHGLRHTHASLLMYDGVSIPSVAQRLGHASTLTTQSTYLHIVKELESLDNHKIMENMIRLS